MTIGRYTRGLVTGFIICLAALLAAPIASADGEEARVRALVDRAVEDYRSNGSNALVKMSQPDGGYLDGELYIFVLGPDIVLAHAGTPASVGQKANTTLDWDGTPVGERIRKAATSDGNWATYHHRNPATGRVEHKRSWVRIHDGLIFGAGLYSK